MVADTLEVVAGKINALQEKIGKANKDSRHYRITRNELIKEAHKRISDGEIEATWDAWVEENLTITRRATYKILELEKPQHENGELVHQNECVEYTEEDFAGTVSTEVQAPPPDPVDRIMSLIMQLTREETERLDERYREHRKALGLGQKAPPKPRPAPTPVDPRVTGAIGHFFESVPANKRLWVQQRMEEQPTTIKGGGVHVQWIEAFWDCTPEQQLAIKEGIKLENTKRMEG